MAHTWSFSLFGITRNIAMSVQPSWSGWNMIFERTLVHSVYTDSCAIIDAWSLMD